MPWPTGGGATTPVVATPAPVPSAAAVAWWELAGGLQAYTLGWHNGQCTELAWERRPDIVARVAEDWYDRSVGSAVPIAPVNWDATFWDVDAAAAGFEVGIEPRVGAIMVYHSPDYPTWPGHVAWVQSVNVDGSFVVQEEDAPVAGHVTERRLTLGELRGSDVDFIYSLRP